MNNEKRKKGFTLVELLSVILVLAILMSITLVVLYSTKKSSNKNIDDMTKSLILDSVKSYATEFKSSDEWKEEVSSIVNADGTKESVTSYCVSIDALINSGYFKSNNKNVNDYRDKYVALITEKNGAISVMELIEKETLTNDVTKANKCQYEKKEYNSFGNFSGEHSIKYNIDGSDVEVAKLGYKFSKVDDYTYDVNFTLTNTLDITKIPINKGVDLIILLDYSGSMEGLSYNLAKQATVFLSEKFINSVKKSRVGLIGFSNFGNIIRDLKSSSLEGVNFPPVLDMTNVNNGIDEAIYLFNKSNSSNNLKYVLLLYDGFPNYFSYYTLNGRSIYPSSKEYYDNYESYGRNRLNNAYSSGNNILQYLGYASNYLKSPTGGDATLITVGYGFTGNNSLKEISSKNDIICSNNDYSAKRSENYCYFSSDSGNVGSVFSKIGDAITADVVNKLTDEVDVETSLNTNLTIEGKDSNNIKYSIKVKDGDKGSQSESLRLKVDPRLLQENGEATIDIFNSIDISFKDKDGKASGTYKISDNFPKVTLKKSIVSKLN